MPSRIRCSGVRNLDGGLCGFRILFWRVFCVETEVVPGTCEDDDDEEEEEAAALVAACDTATEAELAPCATGRVNTTGDWVAIFSIKDLLLWDV